jgi:hypothetical protein
MQGCRLLLLPAKLAINLFCDVLALTTSAHLSSILHGNIQDVMSNLGFLNEWLRRSLITGFISNSDRNGSVFLQRIARLSWLGLRLKTASALRRWLWSFCRIDGSAPGCRRRFVRRRRRGNFFV